MKRDKLEQFIAFNRDSFDEDIPSLKVWSDIDRELDRRMGRRVRIWQGLRVAAAAIVLLTAGALLGIYIMKSQNQEHLASLARISPEFTELEQYYNEQINDRYQRLVSFDQSQVVDEDLAQIDQVMQELKQELLEAPTGSEERIVENLIKSYQTKVEILERVLDRIQTIQPSNQNILKTEGDEISI